MTDARLNTAIRSALAYLTPPASTPAGRAQAARDGLAALDGAKRAILRADIAADPDAHLLRTLDDMARELTSLAAALDADAEHQKAADSAAQLHEADT